MQAVPLFCKFLVSNLGHGCTSEYFFFCPAIQSFKCHLLWLRNQIVGRASDKHPDALLHPQLPVVTLLLVMLELLRRCLANLWASLQNYTTSGSDRITIQAGKKRRIRTQNTQAHTSCKTQPKFPKWCSLHKHPDGTLYHPRTALI